MYRIRHARQVCKRACCNVQLPEAEQLVAKAKGKTVVLLNAQWTDTKSVPSRHGSFVGSFETVYCFQPIAIQVCSSKASR